LSAGRASNISPSDPVFIGGMYKSGTSLLRAMLGRHSRLFAGLETQWLHERWEGDGLTSRQAWLERLSTFFDVPLSDLERVCRQACEVETCLDYLMAFLAARAGKARWIEKTPGNVGAIGRILTHWPRARILHIIRDPRDVYASMIESRKWTNPEEFAGRWCATVAAARKWLAGQGGTHPSYCELRYERLVCAPEAQIRLLLAFLDERFEAQVAAFSGQPEDFDRVRRATGKDSPTLRRLAKPITAARVGVWSTTVMPEQWREVQTALVDRGSGDLVGQLIAETDAVCASAHGDVSKMTGA
jgi:Sulfotransferase family